MFLTEKKWLNMFDLETKMTFKQFIRKSSVRLGNSSLINLITYMAVYHIHDTDIKYLYEFWTNRNEYLLNIYKKSLEVDLERNDFKISDDKSLKNNYKPYYKNLIRNLFWKELWIDTTTSIKNVPNFFTVINDFLNHQIIDYKLLTPSIINMMNRKQPVLLSSLLSGLYFRSSIMNPYMVYKLFKNIIHPMLNNKKDISVFTPTLGWGSYLYGLLNTDDIKTYIGDDVISSVCNKTEMIADKFFPEKTVDIYCVPSEDLVYNKEFLKKYSNNIDFIFFSPPYYTLEEYPGNKQSTNIYKSYEEWLENYWSKTIELCSKILQKKGLMVYIISKKFDSYNLEKDMNKITKRFFKLVKKIPLQNSNVDFTKHRDTGEYIYIWEF
jgi:hypothetical protein